MMAEGSLQIGDLVEILPAERPLGQPAPPRRYGRVLAVEAEDGRAAVQIEDRHYPLYIPPHQLRRVDR
jgi:hypothetical protein